MELSLRNIEAVMPMGMKCVKIHGWHGYLHPYVYAVGVDKDGSEHEFEVVFHEDGTFHLEYNA